MKKITLLSLLFALGLTTNAQILNGSFETWTNSLPDNWYGLVLPPYNLLSQSTIAHTGSYAVNLHVDDGGGGQPITTFLSTGDGSTVGHPLTIIPNSVSFWYRLAAVNNDQLNMTAVVYAGGNAVGAGGGIYPAAANYTLVSIPITYSGPAAADSIAILFVISNASGSPTIGSDAQIDDVSASVGAAIQDVYSNAGFTISPNPATDYILIERKDDNYEKEISIYSISGKKVYADKLTGEKMNIDIRDLAPGVYRCMISSNAGTSTIPFIIARNN